MSTFSNISPRWDLNLVPKCGCTINLVCPASS